MNRFFSFYVKDDKGLSDDGIINYTFEFEENKLFIEQKWSVDNYGWQVISENIGNLVLTERDFQELSKDFSHIHELLKNDIDVEELKTNVEEWEEMMSFLENK